MKFRECLRTDQTFTHVDDDGNVIVLNATAVTRWAQSHGIEAEHVEINPDQVEFIVRNHAVSHENARKVPADRLLDPITLIKWGDDTETLIDGNHRYVRAAQLHYASVLALRVPEEGWRQCLITDLPPDAIAFLAHDVKKGAPPCL